MAAVLSSVASLKSGGFSVTCHVPHEELEAVGVCHEIQGKRIRLEITEDE